MNRYRCEKVYWWVFESEDWERDTAVVTVIPGEKNRTKSVRHLDKAVFIRVLRHKKPRDPPCLPALRYWEAAAPKKTRAAESKRRARMF